VLEVHCCIEREHDTKAGRGSPAGTRTTCRPWPPTTASKTGTLSEVDTDAFLSLCEGVLSASLRVALDEDEPRIVRSIINGLSEVDDTSLFVAPKESISDTNGDTISEIVASFDESMWIVLRDHPLSTDPDPSQEYLERCFCFQFPPLIIRV
jgi:hypothetical protein